MTHSLDSLPDDVLLLTLGYFDAGRDIANLALSSRRLYLLIQSADGWRTFVRNCFPSLTIPEVKGYGWDKIAESLTWQTRSWDRRSLAFRDYLQPIPWSRGQRVPLFQPVLDVHINWDSHEELLVWGAGEDVVARRRWGYAGAEHHRANWYRSDGANFGFRPGYDDVKAVAVVPDPRGRQGELSILTGRDNGHLALLDASEDRFGESIASFIPSRSAEDGDNDHSGALATQNTINSIDVVPRGGLFAATTKSHVLLYSLPPDDAVEVQPSDIFDISPYMPGRDTILSNAKWMGDENLVLGLSGSINPLRYLTVTPAGYTLEVAAKNAALDSQFGLESNRICANSIQPLHATSITNGRANLVLSAWRDGTCRLQDIRSPSPFDVAYCDNIDPWLDFEAILPFGTSHFVAGGARGAALKVFDFRWTRDYYHSTALPCGNDWPFPVPHQPFAAIPTTSLPPRSCCDHLLGFKCQWHELSRDIYYRPNGSFFFSKSLPKPWKHAGVWNLARASHISPNFYAGISGAVVEVNLQCSETGGQDPNFAFADHGEMTAKDARYSTASLDAYMMEFGDGLASPDRTRSVRMPQMRGKGWGLFPETRADLPADQKSRHRLDATYQAAGDYGYDIANMWWRRREGT